MARLTNHARVNLDFVTGAKNGEPLTESLAPGETREIPVDLDSAPVKACIHTGLISVSGRTAPQEAPAKGK